MFTHQDYFTETTGISIEPASRTKLEREEYRVTNQSAGALVGFTGATDRRGEREIIGI